MIKYPEVGRKLPEVFELIILIDRKIDECLSRNVINLKEYLMAKEERYQYSSGAQNFIKRQKGGNQQ